MDRWVTWASGFFMCVSRSKVAKSSSLTNKPLQHRDELPREEWSPGSRSEEEQSSSEAVKEWSAPSEGWTGADTEWGVGHAHWHTSLPKPRNSVKLQISQCFNVKLDYFLNSVTINLRIIYIFYYCTTNWFTCWYRYLTKNNSQKSNNKSYFLLNQIPFLSLEKSLISQQLWPNFKFRTI